MADEQITPLAARPALVCVDDAGRQAAVTGALKELGYAPEVPTSAENALDRMRKTAYEVVIVDETFEGATALDNATAFARSVNAVFSYGDLDQLGPMLQRAIADNDAFYRVFREVLKAAGKR